MDFANLNQSPSSHCSILGRCHGEPSGISGADVADGVSDSVAALIRCVGDVLDIEDSPILLDIFGHEAERAPERPDTAFVSLFALLGAHAKRGVTLCGRTLGRLVERVGKDPSACACCILCDLIDWDALIRTVADLFFDDLRAAIHASFVEVALGNEERGRYDRLCELLFDAARALVCWVHELPMNSQCMSVFCAILTRQHLGHPDRCLLAAIQPHSPSFKASPLWERGRTHAAIAGVLWRWDHDVPHVGDGNKYNRVVYLGRGHALLREISRAGILTAREWSSADGLHRCGVNYKNPGPACCYGIDADRQWRRLHARQAAAESPLSLRRLLRLAVGETALRVWRGIVALAHHWWCAGNVSQRYLKRALTLLVTVLSVGFVLTGFVAVGVRRAHGHLIARRVFAVAALGVSCLSLALSVVAVSFRPRRRLVADPLALGQSSSYRPGAKDLARIGQFAYPIVVTIDGEGRTCCCIRSVFAYERCVPWSGPSSVDQDGARVNQLGTLVETRTARIRWPWTPRRYHDHLHPLPGSVVQLRRIERKDGGESDALYRVRVARPQNGDEDEVIFVAGGGHRYSLRVHADVVAALKANAAETDDTTTVYVARSAIDERDGRDGSRWELYAKRAIFIPPDQGPLLVEVLSADLAHIPSLEVTASKPTPLPAATPLDGHPQTELGELRAKTGIVGCGQAEYRVDGDEEIGEPDVFKICEPLGREDVGVPVKTTGVMMQAVLDRNLRIASDVRFEPWMATVADDVVGFLKEAVGVRDDRTFHMHDLAQLKAHFKTPVQLRQYEEYVNSAYAKVKPSDGEHQPADFMPKAQAEKDDATQRGIIIVPDRQASGHEAFGPLVDAAKDTGLYTAGLTPEELTRSVQECAVGAKFIISSDCSRMDGRISEALRDIFRLICLRLYCARDLPHVLAAFELMYGFTVRVGKRDPTPFAVPLTWFLAFARASGAPDTSIGNTIAMFCAAVRLFQRMRVPINLERLRRTFRMCGDDTIITVHDDHLPPDVVLEEWHAACAEFGMVAEAHVVLPGASVSFLGRLFDPVTGENVADPRRWVDKFHLALKGQGMTLEEAIVAKGFGIVFGGDARTHGLGHIAMAILKYARTRKSTLERVLALYRRQMPYSTRGLEMSVDLADKLAAGGSTPFSRQVLDEYLPSAAIKRLVNYCKSFKPRDSTVPAVVEFCAGLPKLVEAPAVRPTPATATLGTEPAPMGPKPVAISKEGAAEVLQAASAAGRGRLAETRGARGRGIPKGRGRGRGRTTRLAPKEAPIGAGVGPPPPRRGAPRGGAAGRGAGAGTQA